jgi:hypothetical protein
MTVAFECSFERGLESENRGRPSVHPLRYLLLVPLAAAAPAKAPYSGDLVLTLMKAGLWQFSVSATFRVGPSPDWYACPGTPVDNCCYEDEEMRKRHPPAEPTLVDAGHLAFAHNNTTLGVMAPPATGRPYESLSLPSSPGNTVGWLPGETLRVRGSGGTVHAFDGTMIVPPAIAGVTPDLPPPPGYMVPYDPRRPPAAMQIPRSRPFVMTWTPYAGARMTLSLTGINAHRLTWVTCGVSDASGQAVISTKILARFAEADKADVTLTRTTTGMPQKTADNADITVSVHEVLLGHAVFVDMP